MLSFHNSAEFFRGTKTKYKTFPTIVLHVNKLGFVCTIGIIALCFLFTFIIRFFFRKLGTIVVNVDSSQIHIRHGVLQKIRTPTRLGNSKLHFTSSPFKLQYRHNLATYRTIQSSHRMQHASIFISNNRSNQAIFFFRFPELFALQNNDYTRSRYYC